MQRFLVQKMVSATLLRMAVMGVSVFGGCTSGGEVDAQERLPNVLLILADDMGLGDLGCYNSASKIPTPNLDTLAAGGMRFLDAHSPSAVCTPTRYGLLTGRYSWRGRLKSGVLGGSSGNLIEMGRLTLPAMMKRAGYSTAGIGKWHLGLGGSDKVGDDQVAASDGGGDIGMTNWSQPLVPGPLDHGFDSYFGIPASLDMAPYVYVVDRGLEAAASETVAGSKQARHGGGGFWRGGPMAPGFSHAEVLPRVTEEAVKFLRSRGKKSGSDGQDQADAQANSSPFFLYWALPAPHTPWMPSTEFRGRSGAGVYGDFAAMVDDAVGQVLDELERSGLAENTLVIFTSDNGAHWTMDDIAKFGHRANDLRRGQKADIWEGGHRVPFLVRWPGKVEAGGESDSLLSLTDVMASLATVVGEELPTDAAEDSVDQALGESGISAARGDIIHHSFRGHFAIRSGNWKYVEWLGSGGFTQPHRPEAEIDGPTGQLFNMADDPRESTNLFLQQPEKVAELQALLDEYRLRGSSRAGLVGVGSGK